MEQEEEDFKKLYLGTFKGRTIRIFLSYCSGSDKEFAGEIKRELEKYGVEVFVAHDDITPATEWPNVIEQNIRSCDVFSPLLTHDFTQSKWTDQETGIAYAERRFFIPFQVDVHPYGFIGNIQGLKINQDDLADSCKTFVKRLADEERFKESIKDCLIRGLSNSNDFYRTVPIIRILNALGKFNIDQINEIIRGSAVNRCVYDCHAAKPVLEAWLKEYEKEIDPLFSSKLKTKLK